MPHHIQNKMTESNINKGCSKSYKPHLERRTLVEYFCLDSTLPLLMKPEKQIKINLDFCAGETHPNGRGMGQI